MSIDVKNRNRPTAICDRFVIDGNIFERQLLIYGSNILDLVEELTVLMKWFLAWGDGRWKLLNI